MSRPSRAGRRRLSVVIQSELVNKDHGATENEQIVLDELKRLLAAEAKEQTHSIKYFGGQRRKTVTKTCANLTRAEAGSMIVTAAQRHVDRKHQRVSRFNMFLVAADIDEKHSGCWQAIRTLSFALLFLVVLALQQQPWASVQVTRALREVGDNIKFDDNHETFGDIAAMADFIAWTRAAIVHFYDDKAVQSAQFDALIPLSNRPRGWAATHNKVVGALALKQRRYGVEECAITWDRNSIFPEFAPLCMTKHDDWYGDRSPYGGDAAFHFSVELGGFVEWIDIGRVANTSLSTSENKAAALAQFNSLIDRGWIDKQTREVNIELCTFNANLGIWALQSFHYRIERGGRVVLDRELISFPADNLDVRGGVRNLRVVCEIILLIWVEVHFAEGLVLACHPDHSFCTFETLVGSLHIIVVHIGAVVWLYIIAAGSALDVPRAGVSEPLDVNKALGLQRTLVELGRYQRAYNYICLLAMVLLVLMVLHALSFHRKLAIVTMTMKRSASELLHLGIVSFTIVFFYAFAGYTLIGSRIEAFETLHSSILTLLLFATGEFGAYEEITEVEGITGPIYFFSYLIIVTLLNVNIVIAIIMSTSSSVISGDYEQSSLPEDLAVLFDRDLHTCTHYTKLILCCCCNIARMKSAGASDWRLHCGVRRARQGGVQRDALGRVKRKETKKLLGVRGDAAKLEGTVGGEGEGDRRSRYHAARRRRSVARAELERMDVEKAPPSTTETGGAGAEREDQRRRSSVMDDLRETMGQNEESIDCCIDEESSFGKLLGAMNRCALRNCPHFRAIHNTLAEVFPHPHHLSEILTDIADSQLFLHTNSKPRSAIIFFLKVHGFGESVVRIIGQKLMADYHGVRKLTRLDQDQHKVVVATVEKIVGHGHLREEIERVEMVKLIAIAKRQHELDTMDLKLNQIEQLVDERRRRKARTISARDSDSGGRRRLVRKRPLPEVKSRYF